MARHRTTHICANERVWVLSLFGVLLFVFVLYMYFVTTSVVQVVVRQEVSQEITAVKAKIGTLESEYMALQYDISNDIALHDGYVDVEEKVFVERAPRTLSLQQ